MSTARTLDARQLGLLFAGTAAVFLPTQLSYHNVWMEQPYTHGYLVLAATAWLIWQGRQTFRDTAVGWTAALLFAIGLSLAWLVAHVTNVQTVAQAAVPLLLLLWAGAALGRGVAVGLAPVAALFLLAVPFWEVLIPVLQWMTVLVSGTMLGILRVPATIEGNVVYIPSGTFLIEGGCAGLNYLLSSLVVGALYAVSFVKRWSTRAAVVGLSAAIAIVGNWIRVAALIAIGHATEMQSGLMAGHLAFGWVIFTIGLLAFFPLVGAIEKSEARRWPVAPSTHEAGALPGAESSPAHRPSLRTALLATLAVTIGPLAYYAIGALPTREVPLNVIGGSADGWVLRAGEPVRPYGWQPEFPVADEELVATWTNGADQVLMDRFVYGSQSREAELVGYGSRIAPDSLLVLERLFGQVGPERRLVNEAVVQEGNGHVLVWYWYRVGGVETQSATRAKLLELWAFLRRTTSSELIAISATCAPGDCAEASRVLASFLGSA